jgi:hypothetical protein
MGSSFTGYRGHGFWARDGIQETRLAALADVVPADASGWLAVVARHWREQAGVGFTGCVDAGLDALLNSRGQDHHRQRRRSCRSRAAQARR